MANSFQSCSLLIQFCVLPKVGGTGENGMALNKKSWNSFFARKLTTMTRNAGMKNFLSFPFQLTTSPNKKRGNTLIYYFPLYSLVNYSFLSIIIYVLKEFINTRHLPTISISCNFFLEVSCDIMWFWLFCQLC